jgi:hypothetical protein
MHSVLLIILIFGQRFCKTIFWHRSQHLQLRLVNLFSIQWYKALASEVVGSTEWECWTQSSWSPRRPLPSVVYRRIYRSKCFRSHWIRRRFCKSRICINNWLPLRLESVELLRKHAVYHVFGHWVRLSIESDVLALIGSGFIDQLNFNLLSAVYKPVIFECVVGNQRNILGNTVDLYVRIFRVV